MESTERAMLAPVNTRPVSMSDFQNTSRDNALELATSDDDLKVRLNNSIMLRGRTYSFPGWMDSVQQVFGTPGLVDDVRLSELAGGSDDARNDNERRFVRNNAIVSHIKMEQDKKKVFPMNEWLADMEKAASEAYVEMAVSDFDLKLRLQESAWLKGREYQLPAWLDSTVGAYGEPKLIYDDRSSQLRNGDAPLDTCEERFVRNVAVVQHISSGLEVVLTSQVKEESSPARGEPEINSDDCDSKAHIELAVSDPDLKERLAGSSWLHDKSYTLPAWLQAVAGITGDPNKILEWRLAELRAGSIPFSLSERRFSRNNAVVKQIDADLARNELKVNGLLPPSGSPSASFPIPLSKNADGVAEALNGLQDKTNVLNGSTEEVTDPMLRDKPWKSARSSSDVSSSPSSSVRSLIRFRTMGDGSGGSLGPEVSRTELPQRAFKLDTGPSTYTYACPNFPHWSTYDKYSAGTNRCNRSRWDVGPPPSPPASQPLNALQSEDSQNDPAVQEPPPRGLKRKTLQTLSMQFGDVTNGNNEDPTEGHLKYLANKICKDLGETVINETIHLCGPAPIKIMEQRPDEVLRLAHDKLHTWPYAHVSSCWRRLYEDASLSKAVYLLRERAGMLEGAGGAKRRRIEAATNDEQPDEVKDWILDIVQTLDMGIALSGMPGRASTFEALFQQLENYIEHDDREDIPHRFGITPPTPLQTTNPIWRIENAMSFEAFHHHLFERTTPVIIPDSLTEWPATHKWQDPYYFLNMTLGGRRLVPVEVGKSYTDDNWSQTIIPFSKFLKEFVLATEPKDVGYLAQCDLFRQIPALREDISIPDYCYTTPPDAYGAAARTAGLATATQLAEPQLNMWFGPKNTKTPLHTDPYHNILCQVVGYKYIRLYAPTETPKLYPRGTDSSGVNMENTSQVDVSHARSRSLGGSTDLHAIREMKSKFPDFEHAEYEEAILGPGECLYVPLGWWHYVESLSASISVSFWWN